MKALSCLKINLVVLLLLGLQLLGYAQKTSWQSYPRDLFQGAVSAMYNDPDDGSLYVAGVHEINPIDRYIISRVVRINPDKSIDTLPQFPQNYEVINCFYKWQGRLYAGGEWHIYRFEGNAWTILDDVKQYMAPLSAYSFIEYQGQLIVGGIFDSGSFKGIKEEAHLVAFDGLRFTRFMGEDTVISQGGIINALEIYKGELIVGGNFNAFPPLKNRGYKEVVAWDGHHWHTLGQGILGDGNELVYDLTVHRGELYVGGIFQQATGAPGNGLAKWDGSNWSNVGNGLEARRNWVYNLLFNGDTLNIAGNLEQVGVVHSPFARYINGSYCFDQDTVMWQGRHLGYLGDKVVLGGQSIYYSPQNYTTTLSVFQAAFCAVPSGVIQETGQPQLSLHPNPARAGRFVINWRAGLRLRVYNCLGQVVYQELLPAAVSGEREINLGATAVGLYLVCLESNEGSVTKKLLLQ